MGNIAVKFQRTERLEDVDWRMFETAKFGSLESLKEIVQKPTLNEEQRKILLNSTNDRGWTVLHRAAGYGSAEMITWILSDEEGGGRALGFNRALAKDKDECTALHLAATNRHFEACQAIVNGCRVDDGERKDLLNAVDSDGRTVLHLAVLVHKPEIIGWILTEGVDVGFDRKNVTTLTKSGSSCLHLAVGIGNENVRALLSHCNDQERMNLFLSTDSTGWTALHHAARNTGHELINELLKHPECALIVNRKDNLGMTVLHRLILGGLDHWSRTEWCFFFEPNPSIINMLLTSTITATTIDPNMGLGLE